MPKQDDSAVALIDLYYKLIVNAPELPVEEIYEVVTYVMDMTIKGHREHREMCEAAAIEAAKQGLEYVPQETANVIFDYWKDYRFIWDSFKAKRGIDLNKDRVTWWEFTAIIQAMRIEAIITPNNKSSLEALKAIRIWEEPPESENAKKQARTNYYAFMRQLKQELALDNNVELTEVNNQAALGMLKEYIIANIAK